MENCLLLKEASSFAVSALIDTVQRSRETERRNLSLLTRRGGEASCRRWRIRWTLEGTCNFKNQEGGRKKRQCPEQKQKSQGMLVCGSRGSWRDGGADSGAVAHYLGPSAWSLDFPL